MQITWCEDRADIDARAAAVVGALLATQPQAALALPTGHTPLGLYARLAATVRSGALQMAQARYFNLDDYIGVAPDHPLSYATYMRQNVLEAIGIPASRMRLLRPDAPDLQAECRDFEAEIAQSGGLDLAILGLGNNGHIAFNEPGAPWDGRTQVVQLDAATRAQHRGQIGEGWDIPEQGITMGIATIRAARAVLLLVAGAAKAPALAALLRGVPDPRWPVTSLLGHPRLQVLAERALNPQP